MEIVEAHVEAHEAVVTAVRTALTTAETARQEKENTMQKQPTSQAIPTLLVLLAFPLAVVVIKEFDLLVTPYLEIYALAVLSVFGILFSQSLLDLLKTEERLGEDQKAERRQLSFHIGIPLVGLGVTALEMLIVLLSLIRYMVKLF